MQNIYYTKNVIYILHFVLLGVIYIVKNCVRLVRINKNLTQEELAEKVGVTRQTIGLLEKEKYNPTIALCLKLCQVLDKSLDQLFWMEEDKDER
ncbi:UNVERIFIED_CONTAM: putative transcriptional regulator [Acetivibrio alkalicellulosi]